MVRGIGVDLTEIKEIKRLAEVTDGSFIDKTFTKKEREDSLKATDRWEYLAARFAAKEAVFKAFAHLTKGKIFDFRKIETQNYEDGAPYVVLTPMLQAVLKDAGVGKIHISLTHEKEYACAFVIVESGV